MIRRALRLSVASIAWTSVTSTAELVLGIQRQLLTLVAFGAVGLLDAAGSAMLVLHFRHSDPAPHRERRAAFVISGGLVVLGLATLVQAGRALTGVHHEEHAVAGTAIAAGSIVVLSLLSAAKWRTGKAVGSEALVGDAVLSGCGAVLAAVAVVGTTAPLSWIDPAAGAGTAAAAGYGSVLLLRATGTT